MKKSAAPRRVQGVLDLEAESEPEIAGPGGACPLLTSPPAPKPALRNAMVGLFCSKCRIIFLASILEHPFSVFFRPENIHNGSRAALGPPKIVTKRF